MIYLRGNMSIQIVGIKKWFEEESNIGDEAYHRKRMEEIRI